MRGDRDSGTTVRLSGLREALDLLAGSQYEAPMWKLMAADAPKFGTGTESEE